MNISFFDQRAFLNDESHIEFLFDLKIVPESSSPGTFQKKYKNKPYLLHQWQVAIIFDLFLKEKNPNQFQIQFLEALRKNSSFKE